VFVTVAPIIINGKPSGAIEIFRDITNEYEIDSLKSEFISLASHQLRTPLTAISTYTHMLLQGFRGELEDPQKEFLHTILASANRMNELIDTLLDVQRLESGKVKINLTDVNVSELLRATKQELWPLAKSKSQFLITKESADDVYACTDSLMLTEVCTNLISNAIKYTPEQGEIVISLLERAGQVVIEVKDTGHGIPKELHSRVFTKFFRAPNILKEETIGTGLGLYMVKEIIQNLGGTIDFESRENKGSTFTVTLPKDGKEHANETVRIM
jgi:signal transduction histidine kinase